MIKEGSNESRKFHSIKWEIICKSKDKGGLGLDDLHIKNISLLAKWSWKFYKYKSYLWHKVATGKYGSLSDLSANLAISPIKASIVGIRNEEFSDFFDKGKV